MKHSSVQTPAAVPSRAFSSGSLLTDMADTTWRMFIPTIGLLLLGRKLDVHLSTKPWLMLSGALLGGCIATLLVRAQLRRAGGHI